MSQLFAKKLLQDDRNVLYNVDSKFIIGITLNLMSKNVCRFIAYYK